ncbi:hypothetical protein CKO51_22115 [Rhodopirellula sp. SM50]|nr:hypothetical protein CKO51_22115 [Rhodopirellula sp. SM50]
MPQQHIQANKVANLRIMGERCKAGEEGGNFIVPPTCRQRDRNFPTRRTTSQLGKQNFLTSNLNIRTDVRSARDYRLEAIASD